MADRVLSTAQARDSITKIKAIIDGGLIEQIEALNREGMKLSQPDVWDGNLAVQFRGEWPSINSDLRRVASELGELQQDLQKIYENIMRAGGNI